MRDRRLKSDAVPEEVMCDEAFVYTDPFHGNNFLKKLQELYLHEELCDIKLMVESKEIFTHKSVLAANSPYFEGKNTFRSEFEANSVLIPRKTRVISYFYHIIV